MNAQDGGGREKRILVVDDCIDTTRMMELLLKHLGYSVRTAHDGNEALRVAEEFIPTAVLLDLSMPDMTGEHVADELRRNPALFDPLIVAISGYGNNGAPAVFDHWLVKPINHAKLLQVLSDQNRNARTTKSVDDHGSGIAQRSTTATMAIAS